MKFPKSYLIIAALVVLAIIMLTGKLIVWGLAVLGAALIILGIQQLINLNVKVTLFEDNIKKLDEKIVTWQRRTGISQMKTTF